MTIPLRAHLQSQLIGHFLDLLVWGIQGTKALKSPNKKEWLRFQSGKSSENDLKQCELDMFAGQTIDIFWKLSWSGDDV